MTFDKSAPIPMITPHGPVLGFIDTHKLAVASLGPTDVDGGRPAIAKWLGIPFARAGRWERPRVPVPWTEPKECYEFGPSFPQNVSPFDKMYMDKPGWLVRSHLGTSEDAFHLNVFAPPHARANLPVLVWVYGGNLNSGSANFPIYDPSEFVRAQSLSGTSCIVVTFNYRLGPFGWLATADLEQSNGHVGNFGLYDCISALEWVQQSISNFGGDPDNVTAFGESAGAFLIAVLLRSGRKLFKKAILESGNHLLMAVRPKAAYPFSNQLLSDLQISTSSPSETVAALRAIPADKLLAATTTYFSPGQWAMTADAQELGWSTSTSLWNNVKDSMYDPWIEGIIIGINHNEGTFFNARAQWWIAENRDRLLAAKGLLNKQVSSRVEELYPFEAPKVDKTNFLTMPSSWFYHDLSYVTPMIQLASKASSERRPGSDRSLDIYVYHFQTLPKRLYEKFEHLGVLHTGEVPFVLNAMSLWDYDSSYPDALTAEVVGKHCASFASLGRPGADWKMFDETSGSLLVFKAGGATETANAYDLRRPFREFWQGVYESKYDSESTS